MPRKIKFKINGKLKVVNSSPMMRLLDVIREDLKFTGTKEGCGEGECGACSVWLDGKLVNSCLIPMAQIENSIVVTIEGLIKNNTEKLTKVQKAFLECNGAQCRICTPGMIMATELLLQKKKKPSEADIKEALAGNLCRCTGYMKIFESVMISSGQKKSKCLHVKSETDESIAERGQ